MFCGKTRGYNPRLQLRNLRNALISSIPKQDCLGIESEVLLEMMSYGQIMAGKLDL